ncbi:MAG: hypothetical protein NT007_11770 [Candidatus Kapabacteria bacterium]|nr:hypothetical protein [Candidatus Kapabacteria bacterium]
MIQDKRKMLILKWLIQLQSETYLNKVEELYKEFQKSEYEAKIKPMSLDELYEIINQAEADILNNRLIPHEDIVNYFEKI